MHRYVTAAAVLGMVMTATGARATVILGTWSFEVDAWAVPNPFNPPPPVIVSATFSFDNGVPPFNNPLPAGGFIANIPLTPGAYDYSQTFDSLVIGVSGAGFFIQAQFIDVSTHLFEPSVSPILQSVIVMPSLDVQIGASSFSGSFAPIPSAVPEPSTWTMMLLGFAGLGFMAYRRKQIATLAA
jgi:PEP-CTERM motif